MSDIDALAELENQRDYWIECDEHSRERAEAAETKAATLEANAIVAVSWIDQAIGLAYWDTSSRGIALTKKLALARAAVASPDAREGT